MSSPLVTPVVRRTAPPAPGAVPGPSGAARSTSPVVSTTAVALVLGLALVKGLSPFLEPDVWWHLHVGDLVRARLAVTFWDPTADLAEREYTATQWLPEVITAAAYQSLGAGIVLWLRAAAVVLLVSLVYWMGRRYAGRLPSAVAAGLTLVGAGGGLNPRPQLVSFVLFALTVHAWCGMVTDRRPRWWLVAVFWLWACCHGLWTFGLAVGGLILLAAVADPRTRPPLADTRRLAGLWAACLVAVAATPLGPALLATPFQVAGNASMIADEWRATPLNNVFSWTAMLMVVGCAVLWVRHPSRRPWWQVALLGFALVTTLWMWRLVPLGCIAVSPLLAGALQEHLTARREPSTRHERRAVLAGTAALLCVAAVVSASPVGSSAQAYPGRMDNISGALGALPRDTIVLNDFGISGWLIREHPQLTPVADLRGEIYAPEHLTAYQHALRAEPGWRDFVKSTASDAALLSTDSALADALSRRLGWTTVASTKDFILLRRAPR